MTEKSSRNTQRPFQDAFLQARLARPEDQEDFKAKLLHGLYGNRRWMVHITR